LAGRYFAMATGSYTNDWSVQVDVHLDLLSLSNGQFANLNLAVVNSTHLGRPPGSGSSMMDIAIDRYGNGSATVPGFESSLNSYYAGTNHEIDVNMAHETSSNSTDGALRISFNSTTKELTSWYDADGAVGGYHWVALQTINIGSGAYTWQMSDGGTFWIVLVGSSGADTGTGIALSSGQASFDNFQATGLTAPGITAQPLPQTVNAGQSASFSVTGVGPGSLTYQWQKNRVNIANGGNIAGATTATLTVSNVQLADVGYYIGVVTNSAGSVPSEKAALNLTSIPIATSGQGEIGGGGAFDGTNYLVGIEENAAASSNITAQLVSQTGTLVGSRISVGRTGGLPRVAFDGTNYLMVWEDDALNPVRRLYGAFVSPNGTLVGPAFAFPVSAGASSWQSPQGIAFDGTNYLVIYSDGQAEPFNLCGRFVSPSGAVGNEFVLATNAAGTFQALAWNGSTYLVAWPAHIGGNQNIVQGRTVSKTGVMSDLITIDGAVSVDQNPLSVGTDGTNFLVAWNYDASVDSNGDAIWELRGRLVTPAGGFLGSQFTVADTSNRPSFPAIAFDGANYLVTWTWRHEAGDLDVAGRYFTSAGAAVDDAFALAVGDGNQGISPVVAGGGKCLVAWTDGLSLGNGMVGGAVRGLLLPGVPTLTTQSSSQTVPAGNNATFTAAASGTPTYQWQVSTDGGSTWTNLTETAPYSGTTTGTLTVTGVAATMNGYQYRAVATNYASSTTGPAATLTVALSDPAFLQRLFSDVLGREIDPGALASFGAALAGGESRPAMLRDLYGSVEYINRQVEPAIRLYYAALARSPDYTGLQNWSNALHGGVLTLTQAADQFAGSTEFGLKYGSLDNTGYVQQLYRNVLGREADPSGLADWVGRLNSGASRGTILVGFSESDEFKGNLAAQVEILRLYFLLDKRMPTPAELQGWIGFLKGYDQTETLLAQGYPAGLSNSDYVQVVFQGFLRRDADAGTLSTFGAALAAGTVTHGSLVETAMNSTEFNLFVAPVSRLYLAALRRVPDPTGLDNWVNYVRGGNSLQVMADAFAASQEFINRYGAMTNQDYVAQLYRDVLGREADPAGLASWTALLDAGSTTRGQILIGFSESQEAVHLFAPTLRTFLHYFTFLNATPTQQDLDFWKNDLATLDDQLLQTFLADPAFANGG